ncbi:hypothetical protein AWV79_05370 [Cupriavidus sp. UYMMa02A]|nr:hypothetical protein AWV79_05370 [Cupriavidus sp. UYMMa02A]
MQGDQRSGFDRAEYVQQGDAPAGRASVEPPVLPMVLLTSPASASCPISRRISAGLVPTLPAISDDGTGSPACQQGEDMDGDGEPAAGSHGGDSM